MKRPLFFLALMLLVVVGIPVNVMAHSAPTQPWTTQDLMDVEDGQFRCPETYLSVAEKTQEMERFLAWTQSRYPDWTVEQIVAFRMATLKHHSCVKTLNNIREAAD